MRILHGSFQHRCEKTVLEQITVSVLRTPSGPIACATNMLMHERCHCICGRDHCGVLGERRRRGKQDRRSTEISMLIRRVLEDTILVELMPRSQIDVYVQVWAVGWCG